MFEPRIIAFLCSWCSYTGADTAGIARMKYPSNIRAVRVPCSGRVSPEIVMHAFDQGADGVLILGCHIGECHYDTGNHRTAKRLPILRNLLSIAGLESDRLRLDWVSASEGERFSKIAEEFTSKIRLLGPAKWKIQPGRRPVVPQFLSTPAAPEPSVDGNDHLIKTKLIREKASELLTSGQVNCVIGYGLNPRGRTRPVFVTDPGDTTQLVWNNECSNNLTAYLPGKLRTVKGKEPPHPIAVVAKPCDGRAINVMLAENLFRREQVHVLGVSCQDQIDEFGHIYTSCRSCQEHMPIVWDTIIGDVIPNKPDIPPFRQEELSDLQGASPAERMEFWSEEFDRCIRCYACRQACPLCNCPECLYERDDSTFINAGIRLNEKRTFHLGRAYHLAGRCIDCNACEHACPMGIKISILNRSIANEMEKSFQHIAGKTILPSPIVTVLSGEYKEG